MAFFPFIPFQSLIDPPKRRASLFPNNWWLFSLLARYFAMAENFPNHRQLIYSLNEKWISANSRQLLISRSCFFSLEELLIITQRDFNAPLYRKSSVSVTQIIPLKESPTIRLCPNSNNDFWNWLLSQAGVSTVSWTSQALCRKSREKNTGSICSTDDNPASSKYSPNLMKSNFGWPAISWPAKQNSRNFIFWYTRAFKSSEIPHLAISSLLIW